MTKTFEEKMNKWREAPDEVLSSNSSFQPNPPIDEPRFPSASL